MDRGMLGGIQPDEVPGAFIFPQHPAQS
jgi:hypothetical protein